MIEVFSSGGGTQSCCISALICQGRLPKPDFVVIADTGREMPTTWQYLDEVIRPAFSKIGIEVNRVRASEYALSPRRGVFARSGQLMIPAYSNLGGNASKLSAFCSGAWKSETIDRWFSIERNLTRSKYRKWIGFSFDERTRIFRIRSGQEFKKGLIRLPLVEDVQIRRHEAIKIVTDHGWPEPPRSRCFDCPNQSDKEWFEVKTDFPNLFQEAVDRDEMIRTRDPHAFLHSSITPLKTANLEPQEDLFSRGCPTGECFI